MTGSVALVVLSFERLHHVVLDEVFLLVPPRIGCVHGWREFLLGVRVVLQVLVPRGVVALGVGCRRLGVLDVVIVPVVLKVRYIG